jgi:hypothetical protein
VLAHLKKEKIVTIKTETLAKFQHLKTTSEALTFTNSVVLVYGPPGVGKTTLFLTAADKFAGLAQKGERITCDDLCVIQMDPGGTDGFKSNGYTCPVIDYRSILADVKDPGEAAAISIELARQTGANKYALDTISQLDFDLNKYLTENEQLYTTNGGSVDTQKKWMILGATHGDIYNNFMTLPGLKFALGHAKVLTDDLQEPKTDRQKAEKKLQERKDKVANVGNPSVILDVTGMGKKFWDRANSLQIYVTTIENPATKAIERKLVTGYNSATDAAAKNRFEALVPVNPEFNMGKIIKAIRA